MLGTFANSDHLAVLVLILFISTTLLETRNRQHARQLATISWVVFAVFWLNLIEHFLITQVSAIEGVLTALAVPLCLYVAYLNHTRTKEFFLITRAVAVMGLIYLPLTITPGAKQFLIETVANQVEFLLVTMGYEPTVITNDQGYRNIFKFVTDGHTYHTQVVLACTGIGSISIVAGLVAATKAPFRRKTLAITVAAASIWILNVARVAFITLASSFQWFQYQVGFFTTYVTDDPHSVSYIIADRVIAQSLSVVALVALTLFLVRILPELGAVLNEALTPVFGDRIDFEDIFAAE